MFDNVSMKSALRPIALLACLITVAAACKNGLPSPQNAIGASARLISISPKSASPNDLILDSEINRPEVTTPVIQGKITH